MDDLEEKMAIAIQKAGRNGTLGSPTLFAAAAAKVAREYFADYDEHVRSTEELMRRQVTPDYEYGHDHGTLTGLRYKQWVMDQMAEMIETVIYALNETEHQLPKSLVAELDLCLIPYRQHFKKEDAGA